MKWFKHFSNTTDDDFMQELKEDWGMGGIGRWWTLLEIVARNMETSNNFNPSIVITYTKLKSFLSQKQNNLRLFLSYLEDKCKINTKQTENKVQITIPKLLELNDEYSRKSGVKPDKVALEKNRIEKNIYNTPASKKCKPKSTKSLKQDKPVSLKVWETLNREHKNKYGIEKIRNATINSQIKKLVSNVGEEKAINLIKYYYNMKPVDKYDYWIISTKHPFGSLLAKYETFLVRMEEKSTFKPKFTDQKEYKPDWMKGKAFSTDVNINELACKVFKKIK